MKLIRVLDIGFAGMNFGRECKIESLGRNRNGSQRLWCHAHKCLVSTTRGITPDKCDLYGNESPPEFGELVLRPSDFAGGIAIWGALPPVYNSANENEHQAVHVHARKSDSGGKEIDDNYSNVRLLVGEDLGGENWQDISSADAISYFITRTIGIEPTGLSCSHCGFAHLDEGEFAIRLHRKHMCQHCGRDFVDSTSSVSNPIVAWRREMGMTDVRPKIERAKENLSIRQSQFEGGIALWASNPAIIWTADRAEQEGVHVHAYDGCGSRIVDETYSEVEIDGEQINDQNVRCLMAQRALIHLANSVVYLECPQCGAEHADSGVEAVVPHVDHRCKLCGHMFQHGTGKATIGNPFVRILEQLSKQRAA